MAIGYGSEQYNGLQKKLFVSSHPLFEVVKGLRGSFVYCV